MWSPLSFLKHIEYALRRTGVTTSMTWLAKLRELQEKGDLYMVAKKLAGKFPVN